MSVKTRAELKSENASDFPNNQTRLISPADLRGQMDDITDSALLREDIPSLDVSQAVVTATGDGTQTLADWMGDSDGGAGGGVGLGVDGMAQLRLRPVVNGQTVRLNYHTTPGDYGAGLFRAVTGAAPGTYVDDGGTIIVPDGGDGSEAWLRVWDEITAHVGWFGATCDGVTDDYDAVKACLDLFTNGRTALRTGIIDVGPGFAHATPLIYGAADTSRGLTLKGHHRLARGEFEKSIVKYIGPVTEAAIYFYGGNASGMEDIHTYPGNAFNGVVCTAANTYNTTLSLTVTAGTSVVATPATMTGLQVGCFLGIDAGGANFEIVRVKVIAGATFTADFTRNHAAGVQVGGSAALSGLHFNGCRLICPVSTVYTTLNVATAGGVIAFEPASMAGIEVGMPLRIGSYGTSETVYVTAVTGSTFTASSAQSHAIGDRVMYPTAAVLFGNRMTTTVQMSEVSFANTALVGYTIGPCYAGIRQISGGNTKNIICHNMKYSALQIPFAFEESSGTYLISGAVGGTILDTLFLCATAQLTVTGLEDESAAYWIRANVGSNSTHATFIGCSFQGNAPTATDEVVIYSGQLTFINCLLRNNRVFGTSVPVMAMLSITSPTLPAGLTIINSHVVYATASSGFVRSGLAGGGVDVIADGTAPLIMLGCKGGLSGAIVALPNIVPPLIHWQNTATYDPPSLAAGVVDAAQTMTVTGAVLGDLVEASFSLDLQGVVLRAWVSAANTVKYQFSCPTGGATVDLGSGTVKCRVKK